MILNYKSFWAFPRISVEHLVSSDISRDVSEGFMWCALQTLAVSNGTLTDTFDASLIGFEPL